MVMSVEAEWANRCVADVAQGQLRGIYEDGVRIFRGVPYAAPPVGDRRFKSPARAPSWDGVRRADTAGPASIQLNLASTARVRALAEEIDPGVRGVSNLPAYAFESFDHPRISEDCLYLDIWVPDRAADLPVYVYYHGGANTISSGSMLRERGANFARGEEVIVVRPNYRLGVLGWMHFGLIEEGLREAVNLGLQDQIAALEWVHANIGAFGGDPAQITVGGESAGATAISHLLTNAHARSLFRRAVVQSFAPFQAWSTQLRPEAEEVARLLLKILGVTDPAEFMTLEWERILAAQLVLSRWVGGEENSAWRVFGGVVDGSLVPQLPLDYLTSEAAAEDLQDKQLVFGFAKDEWQFWRGHTHTLKHGSRDDALALLKQVFGDEAAQVLDAYIASSPDDPRPGRALSSAMSFLYVKWGELAVALNLSRRLPIWAFQFSWDLPGLGGQLRAIHTGDIPFVWGNYTPDDVAKLAPFAGIDRGQVAVVSAGIRSLYRKFIYAGDPGADWPRFDRYGWNILWLGEHLEVRPGVARDEWDLMASTQVRDVQRLAEILAASADVLRRLPPR